VTCGTVVSGSTPSETKATWNATWTTSITTRSSTAWPPAPTSGRIRAFLGGSARACTRGIGGVVVTGGSRSCSSYRATARAENEGGGRCPPYTDCLHPCNYPPALVGFGSHNALYASNIGSGHGAQGGIFRAIWDNLTFRPTPLPVPEKSVKSKVVDESMPFKSTGHNLMNIDEIVERNLRSLRHARLSGRKEFTFRFNSRAHFEIWIEDTGGTRRRLQLEECYSQAPCAVSIVDPDDNGNNRITARGEGTDSTITVLVWFTATEPQTGDTFKFRMLDGTSATVHCKAWIDDTPSSQYQNTITDNNVYSFDINF
jgi:hypothetical protein